MTLAFALAIAGALLLAIIAFRSRHPIPPLLSPGQSVPGPDEFVEAKVTERSVAPWCLFLMERPLHPDKKRARTLPIHRGQPQAPAARQARGLVCARLTPRLRRRLLPRRRRRFPLKGSGLYLLLLETT